MSKDSFTSAEFYKYLHRGKFMGTRCNQCREIYLPPRPICIKCFSSDMSWIELSGKGKLVSFTSITVGPSFMSEAGFDRKNPYCVGIVALSEGPRVSGQILGVNAREPETIKIGTPLTLKIMEHGQDKNKKTWLGFNTEE
jgi:uncharacterized OB-fold protein